MKTVLPAAMDLLRRTKVLGTVDAVAQSHQTGHRYDKDAPHNGKTISTETQLANKSAEVDLLKGQLEELKQKLEDAAIETVMAQSIANPAAWYSINGAVYKSKPEIPGIYIHNAEKVVISK